MYGVEKGGDRGMEESGIAADGYNWLLRAEPAELAKAGGEPGPGAHGVQRFGQFIPRRKNVQRIAAYIAGQKAIPAIFL
jgi:hypothetical protein